MNTVPTEFCYVTSYSVHMQPCNIVSKVSHKMHIITVYCCFSDSVILICLPSFQLKLAKKLKYSHTVTEHCHNVHIVLEQFAQKLVAVLMSGVYYSQQVISFYNFQ